MSPSSEHTVAALILVPVFAGLTSVAVIRLRLAFAGMGLDQPGDRSLHVRPTPHGGGLGIVVAALIAGLWLGVPPMWLGGVAVLALLSLLDDWMPLPFWVRLPVHLAVALAVVFLHHSAHASLSILAVVLIAWAINAYNFMDGADGLAGSMAICGFSAYAFAFAWGDQLPMAAFCGALVLASAGFLLFNWHPARIFMGDVGSIPLGFLAGCIGWYGVRQDVFPGWFPILVFAPFLLDASLTLMRRAWRGERVWQAHREHVYQRMVRMGASHDQMCRQWLLVMLAGGVWALLLLKMGGVRGWVGSAAWLLLLLMLVVRTDRRWNEWNK